MENFVLLFLGQNEARNNVSPCFTWKRNYFRVKKKTTFQKANTGNFAKGLAHAFCQKMQNFLLLFLEQNEPRNNVSVCFR